MKTGTFGTTRRALPVLVALVLSGCSFSDLDVFGLFEDEPQTAERPADENLRARADEERDAAEDADTPSLTTVPSRPAGVEATNRDRVVKGLISDRENARYTDEAIRLQGSTRTPDTSQLATRTPPPPPPPTPQAPVATAPPPPPPSAPSPSQIIAGAVSTPAPRPAAPAPAQQASVVVDPTAIDGGGYAPVSAQVSRDTQVATIQFNHNSANLSAGDRQIISTVASAVRESGSRLLVVGHASSRTRQLSKARHEVVNFDVSFARANAVAQALIQSGVPLNNVTVEAVADDQPIYSEAMPNGEAGNRRAEIYFLN
ncbi:MAG: hypothetical protein CL566_09240 [Alphaproteobacteria bacterium]|nr:hypothetical protein [Alphaproteobacteria bacterium]